MAALLDAGAGEGAAGEAEESVFVLDPADVNGDCARLVCLAPGCGRVFKSWPNLAVHQRTHGASALADVSASGGGPLARAGKFHCFVDGCAYGPGGKTLATKKSAIQHLCVRRCAPVTPIAARQRVYQRAASCAPRFYFELTRHPCCLPQ